MRRAGELAVLFQLSRGARQRKTCLGLVCAAERGADVARHRLDDVKHDLVHALASPELKLLTGLGVQLWRARDLDGDFAERAAPAALVPARAALGGMRHAS